MMIALFLLLYWVAALVSYAVFLYNIKNDSGLTSENLLTMALLWPFTIVGIILIHPFIFINEKILRRKKEQISPSWIVK